MPSYDRREFLKQSASLTGRAVAGFAALNGIACSPGAAGDGSEEVRPVANQGDGGYGGLRNAGPELQLPAGFSYRMFGMEGSATSDGYVTPSRHDGMAAFPGPDGLIRLIRNHEVENNPAPTAAMGDISQAYDPGAGGGTITLDVHPETRELVRDFVSLNGTWRNCAGGPTPWGSWLSCEEAFFGQESGFGQAHGYVFEVPADREGCERSEPLKGLGRFVHEAIAVDPRSGIVYETEDLFQAGFYRFVPDDPYRAGHKGDLRAGGRLQMMAIEGLPRYDARKQQRIGRVLPVVWVDIDDPDPQGGPEDRSVVFDQGAEKGGARFSRLEGCFYADGNVYVVATDGGDEEFGHIWQYTPTGPDRGTLVLIFESPGQRVLNRPDNICVSPKGSLIICEDGHGGQMHIRGLTPDGKIFDLAKNRTRHHEMAGCTFSPDGRTLFFNLLGNVDDRRPGMTFAMWGPWDNGAV